MASTWLFPELELLPTPEERQSVYAVALKALNRRWQYWVYVIGAPALASVTLVLGLHYLRSVLPWLPQFKAWMGGFIAGAVVPITYNFAFRRPLQVLIRRELVARRVPVCVGCGYDLRGQQSPRCSECGSAFDQSLLDANRAAAAAPPASAPPHDPHAPR